MRIRYRAKNGEELEAEASSLLDLDDVLLMALDFRKKIKANTKPDKPRWKK